MTDCHLRIATPGSEGYEGQIGIHYAGPTWEANDSSKVVGTRLAGCTPNRGAIPWLKLGAASTSGRGRFERVTFIQRVNTIGAITIRHHPPVSLTLVLLKLLLKVEKHVPALGEKKNDKAVRTSNAVGNRAITAAKGARPELS